MSAKATRKPSETQLLRKRFEDLESHTAYLKGRLQDVEKNYFEFRAKAERLEGDLRAANYDLEHMSQTICSLARQLGDMEHYKAHRERMDARDDRGVMAATDGEARNGADR